MAGEWIELRDKRDRLRGRYNPTTLVLELVERQEPAYWPLGVVAERTALTRLRAQEAPSDACLRKSADYTTALP